MDITRNKNSNEVELNVVEALKLIESLTKSISHALKYQSSAFQSPAIYHEDGKDFASTIGYIVVK